MKDYQTFISPTLFGSSSHPPSLPSPLSSPKSCVSCEFHSQLLATLTFPAFSSPLIHMPRADPRRIHVGVQQGADKSWEAAGLQICLSEKNRPGGLGCSLVDNKKKKNTCLTCMKHCVQLLIPRKTRHGSTCMQSQHLGGREQK